MEIKVAQAAIEAILFASGDPVPADRIASALEIDRSTVLKLLSIMCEKVNSAEGGVKLIRVEDAFQFVTREEYASYIRRALEIRRNTPLTPASLEVLAVIAYNQPVTKNYIEQVRGVDCSGILSNLLTKGLIEENGRLDLPGKPILYGTTQDFLRCFNISSINELPDVRSLSVKISGESTAE